MAVIKEKKARKVVKKNGVVIDPTLNDFSNDPFFVNKAKEAEAFINRHGLPPSISK